VGGAFSLTGRRVVLRKHAQNARLARPFRRTEDVSASKERQAPECAVCERVAPERAICLVRHARTSFSRGKYVTVLSGSRQVRNRSERLAARFSPRASRRAFLALRSRHSRS